MTSRTLKPASRRTSSSNWGAYAAMLLACVLLTLICAAVWIIPLEVVQQWAFDHAGHGDFDRFEAIGQAEFWLWLSRLTALILLVVAVWIWTDLHRWLAFSASAVRGFMTVTRLATSAADREPPSFMASLRTVSVRLVLITWLILFAIHFAQGIALRAHEWPFFRFNSGDVVLPNISDSNRAVIRYLQSATPPNARILVASDQKLFFLSYYLRPRVLLHRMHPASEHVIPLKDQQRRLDAYRLEDLTPDDLAQMPHDYTLEYFEHPSMVEESQLLSDPHWVAFLRRREQNPTLIPPYVVRLRETKEGSR